MQFFYFIKFFSSLNIGYTATFILLLAAIILILSHKPQNNTDLPYLEEDEQNNKNSTKG